MQLNRVEVIDSPEDPSRVRLVGEVTYERGTPRSESYWFEVPRSHAADLSVSGNPWLTALLPVAVTLNEPLRIGRAVDPVLLDGARELGQLWRCWHPHLPLVTIEAEPDHSPTRTPPSRNASFFSAGLDSFFTLLRPRTGSVSDGRGEIDELITVWGFDVPLANQDAGRRLHARSQAVAAELGKSFVGVTTNLRSTRWRELSWEFLGYGPAMGAVALALEPRYRSVLISAGGGYRDLHPSGSHPLIDPLFSTRALSVLHDGAGFTRVEKTRFLISHPVVLRSLRVCWRSGTDENCGACKKCYRAMLMLEVFGALDRCTAFPAGAMDVRRARRIYCSVPWDYREFRDILALAKAAGRNDIARAAAETMRRSRFMAGAEHLRRLARSGPRWSWADRLRGRLLEGWIV